MAPKNEKRNLDIDERTKYDLQRALGNGYPSGMKKLKEEARKNSKTFKSLYPLVRDLIGEKKVKDLIGKLKESSDLAEVAYIAKDFLAVMEAIAEIESLVLEEETLVTRIALSNLQHKHMYQLGIHLMDDRSCSSVDDMLSSLESLDSLECIFGPGGRATAPGQPGIIMSLRDPKWPTCREIVAKIKDNLIPTPSFSKDKEVYARIKIDAHLSGFLTLLSEGTSGSEAWVLLETVLASGQEQVPAKRSGKDKLDSVDGARSRDDGLGEGENPSPEDGEKDEDVALRDKHSSIEVPFIDWLDPAPIPAQFPRRSKAPSTLSGQGTRKLTTHLQEQSAENKVRIRTKYSTFLSGVVDYCLVTLPPPLAALGEDSVGLDWSYQGPPARIRNFRDLYDEMNSRGCDWDFIFIEAKKVYPSTPDAARALMKHIYQAVGQCVATAERLKKDGIFQESELVIKLVLTTGEAWMFGCVDCRIANKRTCHYTDVLVDPDHRPETIHQILRMLVYWLGSPGRSLLEAFPGYSSEDC